MTAEKNRPVENEAAPKAFVGADTNNSTSSSRMREEALASMEGTSYLPLHWDRSTRLTWATEEYLSSLDRDNLPEHHELVSRLLEGTKVALHLYGKFDEDGKFTGPVLMTPTPSSPDPFQVARLMMFTTPIALVELAPEHADLMAYQFDGVNEGTYSSDTELLRLGVRRFVSSFKVREVDEVLAVLRQEVPRRAPNKEPHLSPVKNGVFNRLTQELEPHSPERLFMFKGKINCVPNATLPVITMPDGVAWDPQSGIDELTDDPELKILLWQLITMVVYPFHNWGLFPMLFSRKGSNGKGMLIAIMRQLSPRYSGANLDDMASKFLPPELLKVSAVLADENPVGMLMENMAGFKALVTRDAVGFEMKHKDKFTAVLILIMIMCFNEFPKVKDRSGSFLRRLLWVPFFKSFKGSGDRKYIRDDYIVRQDVLEYILWQALSSQHTKLIVPQASKDLMAEFMLENDSVRSFWHEFEDRFVWNALPWDFLYDLFKAWYAKSVPMSKGAPSKSEFKKSMGEILDDSDDWEESIKFRASNMVGPELLIGEWKLEDWMSATYSGANSDQRCIPPFRASGYPGIKRTQPVVSAAAVRHINDIASTEGEAA